MALRNKSVATIDAPEFINLSENAINPGISKCDIKVFYLGKNRNGSYIDKDAAVKMAETLPGTPIVASWKQDKEDFGGHGRVVTIEDGEIKFSVNTVPYGFVAPDAKVWFKNFTDTDEFGNEIDREYLMTTGYLWTGQYPELDKIIQEGQGQSMEISGDDMDGHWATDNTTGAEFFIINDAAFMNLCVLGDDVEPCYEGASIESPDISTQFSVDKFNHTLFSMMNELKDALENKGGSDMPNEEIQVEEETETVFEATEEVEEEAMEAEPEVSEVEEEAVVEPELEEGNDTAESDEDEIAEESLEEPEAEFSESESTEDASEVEEQEEAPAVDYAALQSELDALRAEVEELRAFKLERENADKDALIAKYHMLSDEDKAEVVANKENYSLDEIEGKLALIYVQKNVDFETVDGQAEVEEIEAAPSATTFSLEDTEDSVDEADAFLMALRNTNLF